MKPAKLVRLFGLIIAFAAIPYPSRAGSIYYWNASGSGTTLSYGSGTISPTNDNWTSNGGTSYVGWTESTGDTMQIGSNSVTYTGGSTAPSFTLTLGQATSMAELVISGNLSSGSTDTVTISDNGNSSNTLTFGANGSADIQNNAIGNPLVISANIATAPSGGMTFGSISRVILTENNGYSGGTIIEGGGSGAGGVLQVGNGGTTGALGSGGITFNANGQTSACTLDYDLSSGVTVSNNITVSSGDTLGAILQQSGAGAVSFTGTVTNSSAGSLTVNVGTSESFQFSGVVNGTGAGQLVKSGTGTLQISGNSNTYSGGTTISTGNLQVTNTTSSSSATGSGGVSLGSATLSGTGYVTGLVTATGASGASNITVATTGSVGTLTLNGGVTSASGLTLNLAVDGASGTNSLLSLGSSNLTVTSGTLTFNLYDQNAGSNLLTPNTPYTIVSGTDMTPSSASAIAANLIGSTQYALKSSYGTNGILISGDTITFEVQSVPEPSTWAMTLGGLAFLVLLQRRRIELARADEMGARS